MSDVQASAAFNKQPNNSNDMETTIKEFFQYICASVMILSGVVLTFICFFTKGDVTEGVLWYMAQALTFAGGVFGLSVYFRSKMGELRSDIEEYINSITKKNV